MAHTDDKLVRDGRLDLILRQPFFGLIALNLQPEHCPGIGTLGTDGQKLYYDPNFIRSCDRPYLRFAIAHEVMHCVFHHMTRRGKRDPELWNMAGDHVINLILKDSKFQLFDWVCANEKYRGWTTAQIYDDLYQQAEKRQSGQGGQGGDGQGRAQAPQKRAQAGQGKRAGQCPGHGHGHAHSQPCGGIIEPTDANGKPLEDADKKVVEAQVAQWVSQAAQHAKAQGNLPGALKSFIDELTKPRVDWHDQMRYFMECVSRNDYEWTRPNRRHLQRGFCLPSRYSEHMGELVVAIDCSGSVSDKDLQAFASELNGILGDVQPEMVYVVYCDTKVTKVDEFTPEDLPLKLTIPGRGGTDFRPPFDWVERNDIDPACMVYFTDLMCSSHPAEPDYPVMWATLGESHWQPPFGDHIVVEQ